MRSKTLFVIVLVLTVIGICFVFIVQGLRPADQHTAIIIQSLSPVAISLLTLLSTFENREELRAVKKQIDDHANELQVNTELTFDMCKKIGVKTHEFDVVDRRQRARRKEDLTS